MWSFCINFESMGGFIRLKIISWPLNLLTLHLTFIHKALVESSTRDDITLFKHGHILVVSLEDTPLVSSHFTSYISQIFTGHPTSMLRYGCCTFLDELFHLMSLSREVTSWLLNSPQAWQISLSHFSGNLPQILPSGWSINSFPGLWSLLAHSFVFLPDGLPYHFCACVISLPSFLRALQAHFCWDSPSAWQFAFVGLHFSLYLDLELKL